MATVAAGTKAKAAAGPRWLRPRRGPVAVAEIGLRSASDSRLQEISTGLALGLTVAELHTIADHYRTVGREPTDLELQAFGQAWSEHCCYKSSKPLLRKYLFSLTDGCTLAKGDAGVVAFDGRWAYALRIESHNHPSAVEPYGGAATGIGGIVRDVLAMGAQPIALVDPLYFGPLDLPLGQVPKGTHHPRYLVSRVVAGIRDYGNRLGLPTVAGSLTFDRGYTGNCLVNVGCVGIVRRSQVQRNAVGGVGDRFVLLGGATGRDGIHGVTFASRTLRADSASADRSSVQLGDPIMEEPLVHVVREVVEAGLSTGVKDLGGGGLSCVVGEMALAAGCGAEVHLDRVPLKARGLAPWEVWVSESQERMMVTARAEDVPAIAAIAATWDVPCTDIGTAIPPTLARVLWKGVVVGEMDLPLLTGGPIHLRPRRPRRLQRVHALPPQPKDLAATLRALLSHPNVCSREWVIRQYDHTVRGATTVQPLQGAVGHASHGDAAVVTPVEGSDRSLAIAVASTPSAAAADPYRGGVLTVDEAARNLAAVGAVPHAMTDCLNFGSPEIPTRLWDFQEVVRGLHDGAAALGVSFPSGNVSFYNEGAEGPIPPTATILAVGMLDHLGEVVTSDLKGPQRALYHLGTAPRDLGGSVYLALCGGRSPVPATDLPRLAASCGFLRQAAVEGLIDACHDVGEGGIGVTAAEMAFGGAMGLTLDLAAVAPTGQRPLRTDVALFGEGPSRWLLSAAPGQEQRLEAAAAAGGVPLRAVGSSGGRSLTVRKGKAEVLSVPLSRARQWWSSPLWELLGGQG